MIGRLTTAALTLLYPILVFSAMTAWGVEGLGYLIVGIGLARLVYCLIGWRYGYEVAQSGPWLAVLLIILGIWVVGSQQELPARLYPVFVNFGLLVWFGISLIRPPSVIENIARFTEPELPEYAVIYTRKVTAIWCGFFFVNGMIALYTALVANLFVWTLYNGAIAYGLMGLLFTIEYLVRRRLRANHESHRV